MYEGVLEDRHDKVNGSAGKTGAFTECGSAPRALATLAHGPYVAESSAVLALEQCLRGKEARLLHLRSIGP